MTRIIAALLLSVALGSCATVPAYDRETLSHRAMRDGVDPEADAMAAHVAGAREAALSPASSGGGGCGCN